jgi:hypothetical protein
LYVREEMPAEEYEAPHEASGGYESLGTRPGPVKASFPALPTVVPAAPVHEAREEKEPAQLTLDKAAKEPAPEPAAEPVKAPAPVKAKASVKAVASEPAPAVEAPAKLRSAATVVAFGPYKGRTSSELSDEELAETIDMAHEKLLEQPKAKWAKAMRDNLAALETEAELRCRVPSAKVAAEA